MNKYIYIYKYKVNEMCIIKQYTILKYKVNKINLDLLTT